VGRGGERRAIALANPGLSAWIDGLDIPFARYTGSTFFEFGPDQVDDTSTPERSRSEGLWAHPGLRPLMTRLEPTPATPLLAYRWEHTDRALAEQLALEAEGDPVTVEPGHAVVGTPRRRDRAGIDLFRFSVTPVFEALHQHRVQVGEAGA
jgi:hypothetical protein